MSHTIFHVTVATLVGAMAVAGVAIAMAPSTAVPIAAAPEISTAEKDVCMVKALSRLPKIDGMRVTNSSYQFYKTEKDMKNGIVSVSVEVRGHQASYNWLCSIAVLTDGSNFIQLIAMR